MSNREQYWEQIQDLLDERRDPFDDEEVTAWLLEHPEELDAVVRMRTALSILERAPRRASGWRTIGLPIAAGIAGLLLLWRFAENGPPPPPVVAQAAPPGTGSRIIDVRLSVMTESANRRITTVFDGETYSRQVDRFPDETPGESALLANTTISTLTSRRYPR